MVYIMPNDQELVLELQRGRLEALGQLYDRYQTSVYRTAYAITGDSEVANDLLQDVFLRLYRFADHIDPQRPLEPWLYRMTVNLSYTWIKRSQRWIQPLEDFMEWLVGSETASADSITEQNDDWNQVQSAILSLPLQQRMVVVLYYLDDLSLQEISEILNIPLGTVKSRLHYGRLALRQKLGMGTAPLGDLQLEKVT
jgi:RNA polymerase sigma-70 factor (ECF subfamily)